MTAPGRLPSSVPGPLQRVPTTSESLQVLALVTGSSKAPTEVAATACVETEAEQRRPRAGSAEGSGCAELSEAERWPARRESPACRSPWERRKTPLPPVAPASPPDVSTDGRGRSPPGASGRSPPGGPSLARGDDPQLALEAVWTEFIDGGPTPGPA
mmetsp:Transcript_34737/g.99745  ORF Transcript_34737/g.99745 Transcript_34737/m.99745 type:complete len:157 (+) Transcript_34737:421-891(+)